MNYRMMTVAALLVALPACAAEKESSKSMIQIPPCIYCNLLIRVLMVI